MSVTQSDILESVTAASEVAGVTTITFASAPSEGEAVILMHRSQENDDTQFTWPSGFALIDQHLRSNESLYVYGKIAGASESASYEITNAGDADQEFSRGMVIAATNIGANFAAVFGTESDNNTATNASTIVAGGVAGVSATAGSLIIAVASNSLGGATGFVSSTEGFALDTTGSYSGGLEITPAVLGNASAQSYNPTLTFPGNTTRRSSVIFEVLEGGSDTTAPVLTSPTAGSLTTDGVTPSVTTDEGNGTLYWGIYADAASPTAAQVVAGTSAILSGSQAVSGTGSQAVSAQTGLDDATSYELFFVHDDAAANRSNLAQEPFTTLTDSTAPSLTSPTAGSVSSTSVAPTVTTNTAEGTAYARVYANGDTPTNAQVQAGTGVTPVGSSTNITVGASGVLNFSTISGLTEGTDYELYFVHEDDATTPNLSAAVSVPSGFTTTAAARSVELTAANGYELRDETGSVVASLNGIVWEWYDDPDSTTGTPTDSGTFNTSAGGEATITITGSGLADGAFGQLIVRHPTNDEIRGNYYLPITVS